MGIFSVIELLMFLFASVFLFVEMILSAEVKWSLLPIWIGIYSFEKIAHFDLTYLNLADSVSNLCFQH